MRPGIVLAVVLCALAVVSPAQARPPRMTFEYAQMVAAAYWAKRGVTVPCHPLARVLSHSDTRAMERAYDGGVEMLTGAENCTILVADYVDAWRTDIWERRIDYCWDIAHEVGHSAGLEHPDQPGISDEMRRLVAGTVMDSTNGAPYPYGCTHPRRFLRRQARLAAARRPS